MGVQIKLKLNNSKYSMYIHLIWEQMKWNMICQQKKSQSFWWSKNFIINTLLFCWWSTTHPSLLVNSHVLLYNSLLQEACFCRPQHPWVPASTPSVSTVAWSCSACSFSMTHRRWSKGPRITPSTAPRNLTPSTRKSKQVSYMF